MKKFFIFTMVVFVCCFMATSSWAAKKVDVVKANSNAYIGQLNQGAGMGNAFGLSADGRFELKSQRTDFNGVTHARYQQTFRGLPVYGMETIVSSGQGRVNRVSGNILKGIGSDLRSLPTTANAQASMARMKAEYAGHFFQNERAGTFVYDHNGTARVVDVVSFFADTEAGDPSRPVFFLDAETGQVLSSFDSLTFGWEGTGPGGNQKVGLYEYGTDYPAFGVAVGGSTCTMNYGDCKSVNLNHGTSGSTAFSYTCYRNTFKQINGAYSPINDAQYFGQVVYDMFMGWYGVPPLTFQLMMRVHYGNSYENAFWNGSSMTFGDGASTFYPLVALDVSAHEVSHGFTEQNSNLTYSGQSGGINEAYSDMAGEAAEYFSRGSCDFECGFDIFKSPSGALRYLCNPPQDGRSIDHVDDYYAGLDVHYSSGVFNKAFCLIAQSNGWNAKMSFDIFTKANQDYWTAGTTYQQGAEGALQAATDLGYNTDDVVAAFAVVGINLGPPPATCNVTVTAPNGGESWQDSTTHTITWNSSDCSGTASISLSTNGGKSFGTTITSSTANDGSFDWAVPSYRKNQSKCRIRVVVDGVSDASNSNFTILK
jgi:Zn-dependent metalloprotease